MISMKDCIDYSDLTEDEVSVIATHEHLPYPCAVEMACGLAQTQEGTEILRCLLKNAVIDANDHDERELLDLAQRAYKQFAANHPEHWMA